MKQRETNDEDYLSSSKSMKYEYVCDSLTSAGALVGERKETNNRAREEQRDVNDIKSVIEYKIGVIFLMLSGLLMLTVGVVVLLSYQDYELMLKQRSLLLPQMTIFTGVFILFASAFRFCDIWLKLYRSTEYIIMMFLILGLELLILLVAFYLNANIAGDITARMTEIHGFYSRPGHLEIVKIWDDMQTKLACCGVSNSHDWDASEVPMSCCNVPYGTTTSFHCGMSNAYLTGCSGALGEWLRRKSNLLAITTFAMFCLHVLIAGLACRWANTLKMRKNRNEIVNNLDTLQKN